MTGIIRNNSKSSFRLFSKRLKHRCSQRCENFICYKTVCYNL